MNRAQNSVAMKKVDKVGFIISVGKIPINKVKITNWNKVLPCTCHTQRPIFLKRDHINKLEMKKPTEN